ncbi:MAG: TetR family transcriptional regulator [Pontiellaceae bacterium]|nr:TetR family transcriptional regulator [Pontiellaceae bacterium]
MARRTKEEAEETRRQILEAALDVFSRKGYSRTTFVDIAQQIGLTKGAVYWHFKTKSDLLVALIESSIARKEKELGDPVTASVSLEALRTCILRSAEKTIKDPQLRKFEFFVNFQIEWSEELIAEVRTGLEQVGEDPFKKYAVAVSLLKERGLVDASVDADKLGSILLATWLGLMRMFMLGLMSEEELFQRLRYGFDSMFNELVEKG